MRHLLLSTLALVLTAGQGFGAAFNAPITGTGGVNGGLSNAYAFSAGFTVTQSTNVALNPAISNIVGTGAVTNIHTGNIIYVRTNGSDSATGRSIDKAVLTVTNANALAVAGDTVRFGSGTFDVGTNEIHFKHGVKYVGDGMGFTTLAGRRTNGIVQFICGESTIQDFTISTRVHASFATAMIGGDIGDHGAMIGTNFFAQRIHFDGESDCLYYQGFTDTVPRTFDWRNCKFTSGFDFIYFAAGNTNVVNKFTYCDFTADLTSRTNTFNANRLTKWITVGYGGAGANMKFDHCSYTVINSLYSYILESGDDEPSFPGLMKYFEFSNCTISQNVTNGGLAVGTLALSEGTNTVMKFLNAVPVPYATNSAIFTNTLWPSTIHMTASGARTNWLPKISFQGKTNHIGLEYEIFDASGSASVTTPLTIRALGGATIDGSSTFIMDRAYGKVKLRVHGTNWVTTGASLGNSLALTSSLTVDGLAAMQAASFAGDVDFTTLKIFKGAFGDTFVSGVNPDGYETNITLGSGLSLSSAMVLSATGSGGTNYPPVISATTNVTVGTGVRQEISFLNSPSNQFQNFQGTALNGEVITGTHTNSGTTNALRSFNVNGSASSYWDYRVASNVTSFVVPAGSMVKMTWKYSTNNGARWEVGEVNQLEYEAVAGYKTEIITNGATATIQTTQRYTNYATGALSINCATDVHANITNAVASNYAITLATPVIGTSGSLSLVSDGSARTLAVLAPVAITWLSTNDTATATNILTTASKRSLFAWRVGTGTDGVSTNVHCWVKNQTP